MWLSRRHDMPFAAFTRMHDEMNRVFNETTQLQRNDDMTTCTTDCTPTAAAKTRRTVTPRADVWETDDAAHVVAQVPGATKEGLEVTALENRLIVKAQVDAPAYEGELIRAEWRPADYHREFALSRTADKEGITAKLANGLLHIRIPKTATSKPRSIDVNVE